jgi:hypothetical protein
LVSEISANHAHFTITRSGRPAVVTLPADDLAALEETIFWLEREVARLRSGQPPVDEGAELAGDEMGGADSPAPCAGELGGMIERYGLLVKPAALPSQSTMEFLFDPPGDTPENSMIARDCESRRVARPGA